VLILGLAADIPREVDDYHNLVPLEPPPLNPMQQKSSTFGYPTSTYKAVNTKDGLVYCLRRIHGECFMQCAPGGHNLIVFSQDSV
jgi:hypothetical protein